MRLTKAINLTFVSVPNASAAVNVPFQVKRIHIKNIAYYPGSALTTYNYVVSDLTQNQPLGIVSLNTVYPINNIQNMTYEFQNPQVISGNYNFTLYLTGGAIATVAGATDYMTIIAEFDSE